VFSLPFCSLPVCLALLAYLPRLHCLPACLTCLPAYLACLSALPAYLPACLPFLPVCLSVCLACLSVCLPCLPACLSRLPVCLACLPCLPACLPVCLGENATDFTKGRGREWSGGTLDFGPELAAVYFLMFFTYCINLGTARTNPYTF